MENLTTALFSRAKLTGMQHTETEQLLLGIVRSNLDHSTQEWIVKKLEGILRDRSTKDLYITYSLLADKIGEKDVVKWDIPDADLKDYLQLHEAKLLEVCRIYLLVAVLNADREFFTSKVANLIQVADKRELETFLKYLVLLPAAGAYRQVGVEALRTNIASVFDAISLKNPYPARFFNDQQWNQMYLKAAFMERDLSLIEAVEERANSDLARIISDYAHERWAASRTIDPLFWRPVSNYLDAALLEDMHRLLKSDDLKENYAGALCCYYSEQNEAGQLLEDFPELLKGITSGTIKWNKLRK